MGSKINGLIKYGQSGYSVSVSGDGSRVAIGYYSYNGRAKVYQYIAENASWSQLGSDFLP